MALARVKTALAPFQDELDIYNANNSFRSVTQAALQSPILAQLRREIIFEFADAVSFNQLEKRAVFIAVAELNSLNPMCEIEDFAEDYSSVLERNTVINSFFKYFWKRFNPENIVEHILNEFEKLVLPPAIVLPDGSFDISFQQKILGNIENIAKTFQMELKEDCLEFNERKDAFKINFTVIEKEINRMCLQNNFFQNYIIANNQVISKYTILHGFEDPNYTWLLIQNWVNAPSGEKKKALVKILEYVINESIEDAHLDAKCLDKSKCLDYLKMKKLEVFKPLIEESLRVDNSIVTMSCLVLFYLWFNHNLPLRRELDAAASSNLIQMLLICKYSLVVLFEKRPEFKKIIIEADGFFASRVSEEYFSIFKYLVSDPRLHPFLKGLFAENIAALEALAQDSVIKKIGLVGWLNTLAYLVRLKLYPENFLQEETPVKKTFQKIIFEINHSATHLFVVLFVNEVILFLFERKLISQGHFKLVLQKVLTEINDTKSITIIVDTIYKLFLFKNSLNKNQYCEILIEVFNNEAVLNKLSRKSFFDLLHLVKFLPEARKLVLSYVKSPEYLRWSYTVIRGSKVMVPFTSGLSWKPMSDIWYGLQQYPLLCTPLMRAAYCVLKTHEGLVMYHPESDLTYKFLYDSPKLFTLLTRTPEGVDFYLNLLNWNPRFKIISPEVLFTPQYPLYYLLNLCKSEKGIQALQILFNYNVDIVRRFIEILSAPQIINQGLQDPANSPFWLLYKSDLGRCLLVNFSGVQLLNAYGVTLEDQPSSAPAEIKPEEPLPVLEAVIVHESKSSDDNGLEQKTYTREERENQLRQIMTPLNNVKDRSYVNCGEIQIKLADMLARLPSLIVKMEQGQDLGITPVSQARADQVVVLKYSRNTLFSMKTSSSPVLDRCSPNLTKSYELINMFYEDESLNSVCVDLSSDPTEPVELELTRATYKTITSMLIDTPRRADGTTSGLIWLVKPGKDVRHAINYFVDSNNEVFYLDAQTDPVYIGKELPPGYLSQVFFAPYVIGLANKAQEVPVTVKQEPGVSSSSSDILKRPREEKDPDGDVDMGVASAGIKKSKNG